MAEKTVMTEMAESKKNMGMAGSKIKGKLSMAKGKMHRAMSKHKGKSGMGVKGGHR